MDGLKLWRKTTDEKSMMHVKQIKNKIDHGQFDTALADIENLLLLGPNNLDALKLKAFLMEGMGHFHDALRVWLHIAQIAPDDEDAISFVQAKQLEDKEHYYFTDELPDGGRRFMAYPRPLLKISLWGLIGCLTFLFGVRFAEAQNMAITPVYMTLMFLVLVIAPWVAIFYVYFRAIHSITLTQGGIEVATRLRSHAYAWAELDRVSFAHKLHPENPMLYFVLMPKDNGARPIMIDLSDDITAIKARTHLPTEVKKFCARVTFDDISQLGISEKKPIKL